MTTLTTSSRTTLGARYLTKNEDGDIIETVDEAWHRVANHVGKDDEQRQEFYSVLSQLQFLCNSPAIMNAGHALNQLSACLVIPLEDSMEDIYDALKIQALAQKTGEGTGFSFSGLRPRGDWVESTQGQASGPVSFLRVFDASTGEIKQGGKRRGANMAVMSPRHPDIREFISCKDRENTQITNFNISVWADNHFMLAVENDLPWDLINPRTGRIHETIRARDLFQEIIERTHETGDPGIIFATAMEDGNPTPWIGQYETTNPCAEQPLLPYEACGLGSINLMACIQWTDASGGMLRVPMIDYELFDRLIRTGVQFLDRCIDVQSYTIPEIAAMHRDGNRKIGLGVMGWADALSTLGMRYGGDASLVLARELSRQMKEIGHDESQELGRELGVFPNFRPNESHADTYYQQYSKPRRNATVTTIAPTGTISIIAGVSSGIEPHFALAIERQNVLSGQDLYDFNPVLDAMLKAQEEVGNVHTNGTTNLRSFVEKYGYIPRWESAKNLAEQFPTVVGDQISEGDHLQMQAAWQKNIDNGVSKTLNLPNHATVEQVGVAYLHAWKLGLKAVAIYRDGSKTTQVLNAGPSLPHPGLSQELIDDVIIPEGAVVEGLMAAQVQREVVGPHQHKEPRPVVLTGHTERVETGIGALYVTVNEKDGQPFELFAQVGRAGSEVSAFTEGLARLTSLALRHGVSPEEVSAQLTGIGGAHINGFGQGKILSVPDALGQILVHVAQHEPTGEGSFKTGPTIDSDICPECHQGTLIPQEGCLHCSACGYSDC